MIDPKKYEGHTPGPWIILDLQSRADNLLASHAPLLLAEVVKLQAENQRLREALNHIGYEPLTDDMEADSSACLREAERIARAALDSK